MRTRDSRTSRLRSRLVRAVRDGHITRAEAKFLFASGSAAARATGQTPPIAPPRIASTAPIVPTVAALPARSAAPGATLVTQPPAAATEPGATCQPVLCVTPAGEYVWRRHGRCGQRVADELASARHQVVETSKAGDLLAPVDGEKPLW